MKNNNRISARIVSLSEVYDTAFEISRLITKSAQSFDLIIAIARGGFLPARLLCDFLNIDRLTSVQIKHYTAGAEELEQAEIIDPVRADIQNKKVLLVDDVNDSGKTLQAAVDHVKTLEPELIKTAVLHEKAVTDFPTDYHAKKLQKWKWLIYQWAVTEDVLEFLKKDDMLHQPKEVARNHLVEKYDLEIEEDLFKQILQAKNNYLETVK